MKPVCSPHPCYKCSSGRKEGENLSEPSLGRPKKEPYYFSCSREFN